MRRENVAISKRCARCSARHKAVSKPRLLPRGDFPPKSGGSGLWLFVVLRGRYYGRDQIFIKRSPIKTLSPPTSPRSGTRCERDTARGNEIQLMMDPAEVARQLADALAAAQIPYSEDIAVLKLLFFRGKDMVDVERLLALQGANLDRSYIRHWVVDAMGEEDERVDAWDRLCATFPLAP